MLAFKLMEFNAKTSGLSSLSKKSHGMVSNPLYSKYAFFILDKPLNDSKVPVNLFFWRPRAVSGELIEVLWQSANQSHILDLNLVDPVVSAAIHTRALRPTWSPLFSCHLRSFGFFNPCLNLLRIVTSFGLVALKTIARSERRSGKTRFW
jgi:hypothetical protein